MIKNKTTIKHKVDRGVVFGFFMADVALPARIQMTTSQDSIDWDIRLQVFNLSILYWECRHTAKQMNEMKEHA